MRQCEDPSIPPILSDRSISHHITTNDLDEFLSDQLQFIKKNKRTLLANNFTILTESQVKKDLLPLVKQHNDLHSELFEGEERESELLSGIGNILIANTTEGLENFRASLEDKKRNLFLNDGVLPRELRGDEEQHFSNVY